MIKYSRKVGSVKVTFALPAEEWAAGCSVVGDFNEWVPGRHQMRRRSNGFDTSVRTGIGSMIRRSSNLTVLTAFSRYSLRSRGIDRGRPGTAGTGVGSADAR